MSKDLKVGDRVRVLKYWEGEGIITQVYRVSSYSSGGYEVKMETGPQVGMGVGGFEFDEVELVTPSILEPAPQVTTMQIVSVKRPKHATNGLKVYGKILGEKGKTYNFAYIRRANFRGWICSCDNFILHMLGRNRNCKHIKHVRSEVGRYGAKVPQS